MKTQFSNIFEKTLYKIILKRKPCTNNYLLNEQIDEWAKSERFSLFLNW